MVLKCIKCGVIGLTRTKQFDLDWEYEGFQWWMQFGIDKDILSQHKRAKGYNYKKDEIKYKDYPLVIPKNQIRYRKKDTMLTKHWVKISVRKRKGIGVWLAIKPHHPFPDFEYLRDSLLVKNRKGKYELRLIFDVPQSKLTPEGILAVDLGEKVMATVCDSKGNNLFLGKGVRGVRRHYAWLRKRLGERKLLKVIKRIAQKERNIVQNMLHEISNEIIAIAKKFRFVIALGRLKGIRKKRRSKTLNRILFNMPFFKLSQMIWYKAEQNGLSVIMLSEKDTSITCHKCGHKHKNNRKSQGLFVCQSCKMQYNADLNAARNIFQRAEEQCFSAEVWGETLKPVAEMLTGKSKRLILTV